MANDVSIIPYKFDEFNEILDVKDLSLYEKQECFADVVAMAILNCDELSKHQPKEVIKEAFPHFETYISIITRKFIEAENEISFT